MGWRKLLFGQYQFAVAGDAQTVFFLVMDDHDFVSCTEQRAAAEPSPVVDRVVRRQRIILEGIFNVFHTSFNGKRQRLCGLGAALTVDLRFFANVPVDADTWRVCWRWVPVRDAPATGLVGEEFFGPARGSDGR